MPVQDFGSRPDHANWLEHGMLTSFDALARRLLLITLSVLPALLAGQEMVRVLGADGLNGWELGYLALFIPLFAWISFGFTTCLTGAQRRDLTLPQGLNEYLARTTSREAYQRALKLNQPPTPA